ncbi:MAG: anhydro-N-acetylmuramic acid kinase [Neisseriaceae bacterium]|nr:anhydro-N-acetylmuramic acid kinase [Neisseriaceae bacterium]MBP6861991.1 anhydro-N-acetylmuramic acid kinase [Neisseriaceae bacterium]
MATATLSVSEYEYYIGLMSGTSLDGVDAVLVRTQQHRWCGAIAHAFIPYPAAVQAQVLALQQVADNELHRNALLAQTLSHLYAEAVNTLLRQHQINRQAIRAIGCHGQTIRHNPDQGYTLQSGDLALLAELTQIDVVGDFRSRDLAAGGQGAPLVPAFHQALFAHPQQHRAILNIGGIANITVLAPQQAAFGFDTGPGNMLMDAWVQQQWQQHYDEDGRLAAAGTVLPTLLTTLLTHPYFAQTPPKSTGRDLFSLGWLSPYLNGTEKPQDVLRTLLEYTAHSITDAIQAHAPDTQTLFVCGGGLNNGLLYNRLKDLLPRLVLSDTAELDLHPQWVEAAAFGWLAAQLIHRQPGNLPEATGAAGKRLLGALYPA